MSRSPLFLPAGMRDLLPVEARSRRALGRSVLGQMELHGYEIVTPPAFELASVLERGLGTLDPGDVLRFVEPESGEVAALRPDMTPQIARMAATRMRELPRPYRLAYEGTVLRRKQGRARKSRQIPQAGLELLGVEGPLGDLEVLGIAAVCVARAGVPDLIVDIGHASLVRSLLAAYPADDREALVDALLVKDTRRVAALAGVGSVPPAVRDAMARLPSWHGGLEIMDLARPLLSRTPAAAAFEALDALLRAAAEAGLPGELRVDLGDVQGFAYYTGVTFRLLAAGPGDAIGGGGRYDDLLARFGAPMPAAGFAIDLDHLAWARRVAGGEDVAPLRVAIVAGPGADEVSRALRSLGRAAAVVPEVGALEHARAWRYTSLVDLGATKVVHTRLTDGSSATREPGTPVEVAGWIANALGV